MVRHDWFSRPRNAQAYLTVRRAFRPSESRSGRTIGPPQQKVGAISGLGRTFARVALFDVIRQDPADLIGKCNDLSDGDEHGWGDGLSEVDLSQHFGEVAFVRERDAMLGSYVGDALRDLAAAFGGDLGRRGTVPLECDRDVDQSLGFHRGCANAALRPARRPDGEKGSSAYH